MPLFEEHAEIVMRGVSASLRLITVIYLQIALGLMGNFLPIPPKSIFVAMAIPHL
jgi:hypothetical protein